MANVITAGQLERFRAHLTTRERSPGTVENYLRGVRAFAAWLDGAPVGERSAGEWKRALLRQGYHPRTINARLAAVHAFFRFAGWRGLETRALKIQRRLFREDSRELTRAEVATIFFRLLEDEVREDNWSTTSGFPDVNKGDWFNTAVSTLSGMEIIIGYEDGTFRPNEPITRAEFVTIATRFYNHTAEYKPGTFPDVDEDDWYADYIQAAVDMELILGHDDGTFGPENPITRAETAAIVNRMLGRRPHEDHLLSEEVMNTWVDNANQDMWYYEDIQEATNTHDYDWIVVKDEPDEDYRTVECWQSKLPDPDWVEIEQGWAAAKQ